VTILKYKPLTGIILALFLSQGLSACSASLASIQSPSERPRSAQTASLAASDKTLINRNRQSALEKNLSGTPVLWENPATGSSGSVTPIKTWKSKSGTYCRAYRERTKLVTGQFLSNEGVACRSANAVWQRA